MKTNFSWCHFYLSCPDDVITCTHNKYSPPVTVVDLLGARVSSAAETVQYHCSSETVIIIISCLFPIKTVLCLEYFSALEEYKAMSDGFYFTTDSPYRIMPPLSYSILSLAYIIIISLFLSLPSTSGTVYNVISGK